MLVMVIIDPECHIRKLQGLDIKKYYKNIFVQSFFITGVSFPKKSWNALAGGT